MPDRISTRSGELIQEMRGQIDELKTLTAELRAANTPIAEGVDAVLLGTKMTSLAVKRSRMDLALRRAGATRHAA